MNSPSQEIHPNDPPALPQWELDRIVAELRMTRAKWRQGRQWDARALKFPSRDVLRKVLASLSAALFPMRLGPPDLREEGEDYFVGHMLDAALNLLFGQVRRELRFSANLSGAGGGDSEQRAAQITGEFATNLPAVRALLDTDVTAAYQGDPAARSVDEVLLCYPGITAILHHRLAHVLYLLGAPLLARIIAELAHSTTGIDIHPGAEIGESFFIDHGTGVVIGETAIIGQRVRIYQAVTLGAKRFPVDENGVLVKGNARHPIVEDDVVIYAGATILGRVTIGRGSIIGGNVWLTRSVPSGSNITQAQVRNEVFDGGAGI